MGYWNVKWYIHYDKSWTRVIIRDCNMKKVIQIGHNEWKLKKTGKHVWRIERKDAESFDMEIWSERLKVRLICLGIIECFGSYLLKFMNERKVNTDEKKI
ncbi:MAG: hypothetical protein Ta2E_09860 [Mycoplasmoidaceae bacterium]|nr:MAG: hypothetical protein Ta2E_09860 [Mycoplasmoidaceae bacterium]